MYIDANHPSELIESILVKSLQDIETVLTEPMPFNRFWDVNDWAAEYVVGYYIIDYAKKNFIRRMVWKSIWRH